MRKYQQMALALISFMSLLAFLFYKHEYDRLRFVFEYLETFGTTDNEAPSAACGRSLQHGLSTIPAYWLQVASDRYVYSAFVDSSGISPVVIIIGIGALSFRGPQEINFWVSRHETPQKNSCLPQLIHRTFNNNFESFITLCKIQNSSASPFLMTLSSDGKESPPILVQETPKKETLRNVTCACVYNVFDKHNVPTTEQIIEFVAHHRLISIEKFVFYGTLLTPEARELLSKHQEEMKFKFEEKQFNIPYELQDVMDEEAVRDTIELDCMLRHRNTFQHVIVLKLNQFIVSPKFKLGSLLGGNFSVMKKASLTLQKVCWDKTDKSSQTRLMSKIRKKLGETTTISIHSPHLYSLTFENNMNSTFPISPSLATVQSYELCNEAEMTAEILPSNEYFHLKVKQSVLYKKFKMAK